MMQGKVIYLHPRRFIMSLSRDAFAFTFVGSLKMDTDEVSATHHRVSCFASKPEVLLHADCYFDEYHPPALSCSRITSMHVNNIPQ